MTSTIAQTPELALKRCIQKIGDLAGVYRFYNDKKELLYVGKARNLKKRLASYLRKQQSTRVANVVSQIAEVEVTLTHTENDALLLESNLIKTLNPRYNVLLRDDKSYPYLVLNPHQDYPRLYAYRGKPKHKTEHFGPYPNVFAMRESLNLLQKLFKLRPCKDTFFKNRARPCLQYQIQRCTAPCVGFISPEDYQKEVQKVRLFLQGKSGAVIQKLNQQMEAASTAQRYEEASQLLDQITALSQTQTQQAIINAKGNNIDVIALNSQAGLHCLYVLPIRDGHALSGQSYLPKVPDFLEDASILSQFISQFYLEVSQGLPEQILVGNPIEDQGWLADALSSRHERRVTIRHRLKKTEIAWLGIAQRNAQQSLEQELRTQQFREVQRQTLQQVLHLAILPKRLECFDISHSQGELPVASCVVFDTEGPLKSEYRRFNIKDVTPGDDYAAIKQALKRRYTAADPQSLPDVLIVDGGKGQLTQAKTVLQDLQLTDKMYLIGIAKGPDRKPGEETLFLGNTKTPLMLAENNPALHLLQQIRDEAHRFALTGHRRKRASSRRSSILESIRGIGPKRRRQLLTQFGGLQGLKRASLYELQQIAGITSVVAESIYITLKKQDKNITSADTHSKY